MFKVNVNAVNAAIFLKTLGSQNKQKDFFYKSCAGVLERAGVSIKQKSHPKQNQLKYTGIMHQLSEQTVQKSRHP